MSLWILYQKLTGRNRVGISLPIVFSIVRTAGASPAELTNGKSYVWFFTKFIASGASPDASCPSLLALISAAGANPDAGWIKLIPPVRMSLWILYQKPTGPNPVGKSLPIMFAIVRTAGASPAELTNE